MLSYGGIVGKTTTCINLGGKTCTLYTGSSGKPSENKTAGWLWPTIFHQFLHERKGKNGPICHQNFTENKGKPPNCRVRNWIHFLSSNQKCVHYNTTLEKRPNAGLIPFMKTSERTRESKLGVGDSEKEPRILVTEFREKGQPMSANSQPWIQMHKGEEMMLL